MNAIMIDFKKFLSEKIRWKRGLWCLLFFLALSKLIDTALFITGFTSDSLKFILLFAATQISVLLSSRIVSNDLISNNIIGKFSRISFFLFSSKTQKEVFEPIFADWQEEYFEALFKKEIWKARWINLRYTYSFVITMWQKSPIADLIEFVRKLAK